LHRYKTGGPGKPKTTCIYKELYAIVGWLAVRLNLFKGIFPVSEGVIFKLQLPGNRCAE
jgi:hypothetical protein